MIEIPSDKQEQIIFNKFYHDSEFRHLIAENFQQRFFDNEYLGKSLDFLVKFFKHYEKLPSKALIDMSLKKLSIKEKLDEKQLELRVNQAIDLKLENDTIFLKDLTLDFIKSKSAYFAIFDSIPLIDSKDSKEDVSKTMSSCIESFHKILGINFEDSLGFDYFDPIAQAKHWDYLTNPEAKIPTQLQTLDKVTNGGIPKNGRCLITFMAPPGVGKSLVLLNLGINFLNQGKFVVIISLEMSEQMYGARATSIITHEDINKLQFVAPQAKDKIINYHKLHPEAKLLIKEYPPDSVSCSTIINYLDKVVRSCGRKPDVIIVDYVNLLLPSRGKKSDNSYEKVGSANRELRAMSYKYEAPVITATQNNRSGIGDSQNAGMEHIADSQKIAFDSDFIGALFHKEGDKDRGIINLGILKNRFGSITGKSFEFAVNYSNLKICDYIEEDNSEGTDYEDPTSLSSLVEQLT